MANIRCGNSCYCDSTGALTGSEKNVKISYISYTGKLAGDTLTLKDSSTSGALKITLKAAVADETVFFDFSFRPLLFPNGIYVAAISANSTACIVLTSGGGD